MACLWYIYISSNEVYQAKTRQIHVFVFHFCGLSSDVNGNLYMILENLKNPTSKRIVAEIL